MIIIPSNTVSAAAASGSLTFDGTGDYVSVSDSAALELGSGNFTIETWLKTTSTTLYATFFGRNDSGSPSGGNIVLLINNGSADGSIAAYSPMFTVATSGVSIRDNEWHHVALVRNSGSAAIYVDGISKGTSAASGTLSDTSKSWAIGADDYFSPARDYSGLISNLRVTTSAVYTANFTPATSPLTAISGTGLLTAQDSNQIRDTSGNNLTLTAYGNAAASSSSPF